MPNSNPLATSPVMGETDAPPGEQVWDEVITPQRPYFHLPLAELWQKRDLLYLFTRRDLAAVYKQTILGPVWFFIQPILTTLLYVLVFGEIAQLSTDGLPRVIFYLSGITLWNYFADCMGRTAITFREHAPLFEKVYFPRVLIPISMVISNLLRFAIQFSLFLLAWLWYLARGEIAPTSAVAIFPLIVFAMAILGLAFGLLLSALTTKYRDLMFVFQFGVQLWMYATPVIYPFSQVPSRLASVLAWNPLTPLFEATRYGFLGVGTFTVAGLLYSLGFTIIVLVVSLLVFNQVERTFIDTV